MAFSFGRVWMAASRLRAAFLVPLALLCLAATEGAANGLGPSRLMENDCLASWVVFGGDQCEDGDSSCDVGNGPGCTFRIQICFNEVDDAPSPAGCQGGAVSRVVLLSSGGDTVSRANQRAAADALRDLGGAAIGSSVAFSPPIRSAVCTAPFDVRVPLRHQGRFDIPGVRTLRLLTMGGAVDRDRLELVCLPQDGVDPPLTSGCRIDLNRTQCRRQHGDFGRFGLSKQPFCLCRTDDSGTECDTDHGCQGLCIAPGLDSNEGACSTHTTEFGCFALIGFFGPDPALVCLD